MSQEDNSFIFDNPSNFGPATASRSADLELAARAGIERERLRCVDLAETLALVWERAAAKTRVEGTYTVRAIWPPFRKLKRVMPRYEQAARDIEAAVRGLRDAVVDPIRRGMAPIGTEERDRLKEQTLRMMQTPLPQRVAERAAQIKAEMEE
jgi:hypothetical protein